jgi:hypothetical protein
MALFKMRKIECQEPKKVTFLLEPKEKILPILLHIEKPKLISLKPQRLLSLTSEHIVVSPRRVIWSIRVLIVSD